MTETPRGEMPEKNLDEKRDELTHEQKMWLGRSSEKLPPEVVTAREEYHAASGALRVALDRRPESTRGLDAANERVLTAGQQLRELVRKHHPESK